LFESRSRSSARMAGCQLCDCCLRVAEEETESDSIRDGPHPTKTQASGAIRQILRETFGYLMRHHKTCRNCSTSAVHTRKKNDTLSDCIISNARTPTKIETRSLNKRMRAATTAREKCGFDEKIHGLMETNHVKNVVGDAESSKSISSVKQISKS
jgi:hypothetical protein